MHVDNFLGNIFVSCDRGCNFRLSIERIYMQDFVHLHVHTQYSLLDGQASVSRLVDKAMKDGMKGIAVTDHGNMFGIKEFTNYVNKKNSGPKGEIKDLKKRIAGIESGEIECEDKEAEIADCRAKMAEAESKLFKPIVGCEMYVARRTMDKKEGKPDQSGYHLIVLAKNEKGYHNLIKLVSHAWTRFLRRLSLTSWKRQKKLYAGIRICLAMITIWSFSAIKPLFPVPTTKPIRFSRRRMPSCWSLPGNMTLRLSAPMTSTLWMKRMQKRTTA